MNQIDSDIADAVTERAFGDQARSQFNLIGDNDHEDYRVMLCRILTRRGVFTNVRPTVAAILDGETNHGVSLHTKVEAVYQQHIEDIADLVAVGAA